MPEPTLRELLDRVIRIEDELRLLRAEVRKGDQPEMPWWERIAGSHAGDPVFAEIVRLGAEIRGADRPPDPPTKRKKVAGQKKRQPSVQSRR